MDEVDGVGLRETSLEVKKLEREGEEENEEEAL